MRCAPGPARLTFFADLRTREQVAADALAALGQEGFAAAWSAGAGAALDDVVAEACQMGRPAFAKMAGEKSIEKSLPVLTMREREILRLLVEGRSNPEIAAALFISPKTVRNHVSRILAKLGVASRTAAATFAVRHGLV